MSEEKDKQKVKKISEILPTLYCFTAEESAAILQKAKAFTSEKGLDELIATLEKGKRRQDELLKKRMEKDKSFAKELKEKINSATTEIKAQFEEKEHSSAESVLSKL